MSGSVQESDQSLAFAKVRGLKIRGRWSRGHPTTPRWLTKGRRSCCGYSASSVPVSRFFRETTV